MPTTDNDDCFYLPRTMDEATQLRILGRTLSPFAGCAVQTHGGPMSFATGAEGDCDGAGDDTKVRDALEDALEWLAANPGRDRFDEGMHRATLTEALACLPKR